MWETPPGMKRKITFFAFGVKCGLIRSTELEDESAAAKAENARYPKPFDASCRRLRRVIGVAQPGHPSCGPSWLLMTLPLLLNVNEFFHIENRMGQIFPNGKTVQ